jgi:hypothetical protein
MHKVTHAMEASTLDLESGHGTLTGVFSVKNQASMAPHACASIPHLPLLACISHLVPIRLLQQLPHHCPHLPHHRQGPLPSHQGHIMRYLGPVHGHKLASPKPTTGPPHMANPHPTSPGFRCLVQWSKVSFTRANEVSS